MSRLDRYIFRQVIGPLIFFAVSLSCIIWLSQSLRMLDLVINKGQSAGTYLYLILLMLPSLMAIVLPVAFFFACLYTINRLYSESELVVMWAAGQSRWAVLAPLLAAAALMVAITLLINLWLMPLGSRTMKDKIYEIRADLVTTLVKEGAFSTPIEGLTVYIKQQSRGGELSGIFVHDNRDLEHPSTYMAARGIVGRAADGSPRLVMYDGNVQRVEDKAGKIAILEFDKYTFDLSAFDRGEQFRGREESERYLSELIGFTPQNDWEARQVNIFAAEGHNRLATPLYNFTFVLVAAAFLFSGSFSRRGQGWRITAAAITGIVARTLGFAFQEVAADAPMATALIYLNPVLWSAGAAYVISTGGFSARSASPPDPEPAGQGAAAS